MSQELKRFYKYLTSDEEVKRWGIYITGAGHIQVEKDMEYPLPDDPSHHYFHWSVGRRITDYQILYISRGKGIFESETTGFRKINTGDAFLLFPGIWHRFRPYNDTGWDEYWIEFNGELIRHYRIQDYLNPLNPILRIGLQEDIVRQFQEVIHLVRDEKPGFQYIASGHILQIMGYIFAQLRYHPFEGKVIENQIRQAKVLLLENIFSPVTQEEIADKIGMGYSRYRKRFKEYTGLSPAQYKINLKINKAKDLLITTNQSMKEIAMNLGFDNTDYFYRIFKQKTGFTPSDYREKNIR
jgi:AraC-like DNA-binding protein